MSSSQIPPPPERAGSKILRADLPPAIRTLTVPIGGPVDLFARLEAAVAAADYRSATTVRRELYRCGWSIVPPRTPSWQRGRP